MFSREAFMQPSQVLKQQDGAWSEGGNIRPGIKIQELIAQVFPCPDTLCFVSLFFLPSLPSPHPKGEEQAMFLLAAQRRWGCLLPPSILGCPASLLLSCCSWGGCEDGKPKCRGSADGGFSSAWCQGRARSCC